MSFSNIQSIALIHIHPFACLLSQNERNWWFRKEYIYSSGARTFGEWSARALRKLNKSASVQPGHAKIFVLCVSLAFGIEW